MKNARQRTLAVYAAPGLVGIAGLSVALLVFSDLFGVHPLLVVALSLPAIWLTFRAMGDRVALPARKQIGHFVKAHRALLAVNLLFVLLCLPLTRAIPYISNTVGAPDEWQHYGKNVEFILDKHRLPVAGKDDIDSLQVCRDNPYGQVPCRYSYQFNPAFNYTVSASTARLGNFVGLSELVGARLASVMWGVIFLNALYMLCRLFLQKKQALFLAVAVGFIPQIIFISSYVNQDIHSLAIGMLLMYATLGYFAFGRRNLRWLLYVSFGLLFTAKYNYFLLALVPVGFLARSVWPKRDWTRLRRETTWLLGSALVLSGFWFVRNLILYHDPLGQSFILSEMTKYHSLGKAWSLFDLRSYLLLFEFDVFHALLRSFFAQFGYLYISLKDSFYTLIQVALVSSAIVLVYFSSKKGRWALLAASGFFGLAFGQIVFNAFTYDFQFQGRYLYVTLPVIAATLAYVLADIARRKPTLSTGLLLGWLSLTGVLVVESLLVLATTLVTYKG